MEKTDKPANDRPDQSEIFGVAKIIAGIVFILLLFTQPSEFLVVISFVLLIGTFAAYRYIIAPDTLPKKIFSYGDRTIVYRVSLDHSEQTIQGELTKVLGANIDADITQVAESLGIAIVDDQRGEKAPKELTQDIDAGDLN